MNIYKYLKNELILVKRSTSCNNGKQPYIKKFIILSENICVWLELRQKWPDKQKHKHPDRYNVKIDRNALLDFTDKVIYNYVYCHTIPGYKKNIL